MKLEDIHSIGILGAGVMGGGIAQCAVQAGRRTIVRDLTDMKLAEGDSLVLIGSAEQVGAAGEALS